LDALAAALLEKEILDEPEIRQATGLSPTRRGEHRRSPIAAFANNGESSPPENLDTRRQPNVYCIQPP